MSEEPITKAPTVSGSSVVIAMFALGILATGALWTYWTKHLEPFMPMQMALNERFKDAGARVEGGQRKLHKGTPSVLSVRMRVNFDPNLEESAAKVQEVVDGCVELSKIHVVDMQFDEIVVLMYFQVKEKGASQKKVSVQLTEDFPLDESSGEAGAAPGNVSRSELDEFLSTRGLDVRNGDRIS